MDDRPRISVVVPVYSHGLTVRDVVRGAARHYPVIAVNDGSTDNTGAILAAETGVSVITLATNQGKAAALEAGFARARELGFTHAITIDADGQHPVEALPAFAELCCRNPGAFVIGVRNLKAEHAPTLRRFSNTLSTFFFRLETGVHLGDTQCGYRVYPLELLRGLPVKADRYAYELEVMVRAVWEGIPLVSCPVHADYSAPTSRLSHFHPLYDFARVARAHLRVLVEGIFHSRRTSPRRG